MELTLADELFIAEFPHLKDEYLRLRINNSSSIAGILATRQAPSMDRSDERVSKNKHAGDGLRTSPKDPWKPKSNADILKRVDDLKRAGKNIIRMDG